MKRAPFWLLIFILGLAAGYALTKATLKPPPPGHNTITMQLDSHGKFEILPMPGDTIHWQQRKPDAITPDFPHDDSPCDKGRLNPCTISAKAAGEYKYTCKPAVCPDPGIDMDSGTGSLEPTAAQVTTLPNYEYQIHCVSGSLKVEPPTGTGNVDGISWYASSISSKNWSVTVDSNICTDGNGGWVHTFGHDTIPCIVTKQPTDEKFTAIVTASSAGPACGPNPPQNTVTRNLAP